MSAAPAYIPGYIPVEIVVENIMTQLPIKSLLRLTAVSPLWHSIITSPDFISLQFKKQRRKQNKFLLRRYHDHREQFWLLDDEENKPLTINSSTQVRIPYVSQYGYFCIVGSCRGVVCVADMDLRRPILLWNPCIRKHLILPFVTMVSCADHYSALGFGYSDNDNDFKVVRVVTFKEIKGYVFPPEGEVFSIKTGAWQGIRVESWLWNVRAIWSPVFLNGVVHWLAQRSHSGGSGNSVLMFRLAEGVFDEIPLPVELKMQNCLSLTLMGESLAVIFCPPLSIGLHCDIYVMQRYGDASSWDKSHKCWVYTENGLLVALRPQNKEALMAIEENGLVATDLEISGAIEENLGYTDL